MIKAVQQSRIRAVSEKDALKRLRLRVAAKLMMFLGFAAVVYILGSSMMSGDGRVPSVPSMRVDITSINAGQADFLTWEGRPVVVYRRSDDDIVKLRSSDLRIRDPESTRSEQPAFAGNATRSQTADVFVAIALGTGQGCTVRHVAPSNALFQGKPWLGGFVDSCGNDRYDLAGRVFENQYATENLKVPQYTIEGGTLILGK